MLGPIKFRKSSRNNEILVIFGLTQFIETLNSTMDNPCSNQKKAFSNPAPETAKFTLMEPR